MEGMNCPNCGAPITGRACEYCGTIHTQECEQVRIDVEAEYTDIADWDSGTVYRVYHGTRTKVVPEPYGTHQRR